MKRESAFGAIYFLWLDSWTDMMAESKFIKESDHAINGSASLRISAGPLSAICNGGIGRQLERCPLRNESFCYCSAQTNSGRPRSALLALGAPV